MSPPPSPVLPGLMQEEPLLIAGMVRHAARISARHEIVSREPSGALERTTYARVEVRARRLAHGLARLGISEGDRVASLASNSYRHLELFYGVPGSGAVLHTVNPRFGDDQIVYILNHAADRVLAFDPDLRVLVERIAPRLETVEHFVVLGDLPIESSLPLIGYEALLADEDYEWPDLDERAAALLCYTSGTTGHPKGVLTSHRSTVIHALAAQSACAFALTPQECVLLIVPMYHAFGWGIPYVAALAGAKLLLPGPSPDAAAHVRLIAAERATLAMGVPTVWTDILDHLAAAHGSLRPLRRALIGGSAMPARIAQRLRDDHGVMAVTGWGMTELSPLGSFSGTTPALDALPEAERERLSAARAGRLLYPLEVSVRGEGGGEVVADGETPGEIWVRGPCVAAGYYGDEGGAVRDAAGWLPTGDVGTIDAHGAIAIVDRSKDLIKSGGEWISSAAIERAALMVPGVSQAAAIAVAHSRWQERPLLLVVAQPGATIDRAAFAVAFDTALPRWQHPDDILIVEALPQTATGKIDKKALRRAHDRRDAMPAHGAGGEEGL
ncbi:long-chain-fatty-acid--CoA ligase [Hephaestia sp. GCM10023244]|uniref:long-chain-fatty-acid--CoA ligase n=1 Tax=unclassified Hephaestia TaxID=2631281 RepID=UPI002076D6EF|nr:long-chain-fatty-acid--CoA ligase [Hephaestia sp. MAHUQ-44]MCM8729806.1 long-chain-fatty-acid--CoA ligase [Hephaestia sp. MAHUQ-44]